MKKNGQNGHLLARVRELELENSHLSALLENHGVGKVKVGHAYKEHLKPVFLENLKKHFFITQACEVTGIHRNTVGAWRESDPEFAAAMLQADARFVDVLRYEGARRALNGYEEPVYQGGKLVGKLQRYSDHLLRAFLAAKDPNFRDAQQVNVNLNFVQIVLGKLTEIIQRVVPSNCPKCKAFLSIRADMAGALSQLSQEQNQSGEVTV